MNGKHEKHWHLLLTFAGGFLVLMVMLMTMRTALPVLAAPGDRYEVKGAGTTAVNGVYTWVTDEKYTFDNSGTPYYILYCPGRRLLLVYY
jgi:hypothetical protein